MCDGTSDTWLFYKAALLLDLSIKSWKILLWCVLRKGVRAMLMWPAFSEVEVLEGMQYVCTVSELKGFCVLYLIIYPSTKFGQHKCSFSLWSKGNKIMWPLHKVDKVKEHIGNRNRLSTQLSPETTQRNLIKFNIKDPNSFWFLLIELHPCSIWDCSRTWSIPSTTILRY